MAQPKSDQKTYRESLFKQPLLNRSYRLISQIYVQNQAYEHH
jgi:hypothetical protein